MVLVRSIAGMQRTAFAIRSIFVAGLLLLLQVLPVSVSANRHASTLSNDISDLAITEIMYHPDAYGLLTGGDLEFIELYNRGAQTLFLAGLSFSSGIEYTFPGDAALDPGAYWVVASGSQAFADRYGFAPAGEYVGQLNNNGERITISAADGSDILSVRYQDEPPWPITAAGLGFSLVLRDAADKDANLDEAVAWRFSGQIGGSPGAADIPTAVADAAIVVNELLPHTDPPLVDSVELYNRGGSSQTIGNWFLTDDRRMPGKFQIPADLWLASGQYWIFDEDELGFGFSSFGEDIYLFSADAMGNLTGYSHGFRFGTSANGVSFGRYLNSEGDEHFPAMASRTLGYANSEPRVGPVVFSEIMYHPPQDDVEYVALVNASERVVPLYDPLYPTNTWRFSGAGTFEIPPGLLLSPGESLIVSSIEPDLFRQHYPVAPQIQVAGPFTGTLDNRGERIKLLRPDQQDADGTVPYFVVDEVRYRDTSPWPEAADGRGAALERINLTAYGDDPVNWRASNQQRIYLPIGAIE